MKPALERAADVAGRPLTDREEKDLTLRTLISPERPLWARVRETLWARADAESDA